MDGRFGRLGCVVAALSLLATGAGAAGAVTPPALPDTALGRLGGELVRHLNSDSPEQIRRWAEQAGASAPAELRAEFVSNVVEMAQESGGVDLVEARAWPDGGWLTLTLRSHRGPRFAWVGLAPAHGAPDRFGGAFFMQISDPQIYDAWPKGHVDRAELRAAILSGFERMARSVDFSGCVTVELGGEVLLDECRGTAERTFGVPIDHETRFRIGSMDKMFTAVAIAQLVEAGKLKWDSTLAETIPDYPDKTAGAITVWQLLHHTSGLGDFFSPEFYEHRENFMHPADFLGLIARQPKVGKPGERWSYSNAGFILLGRIVETASGEAYEDYIQRHVFAPAGMTATGFDRLEDITPKLAVGYFKHDVFGLTAWKANWETLPYHAMPAGGGYSTNTDLLRFAAALRGGKLVEPDTLSKMFDGEAAAHSDESYATGFDDIAFAGRHLRGHNGAAPGMSANLLIVWETGAAVAVTANMSGQAHAYDFADHVAKLLAVQ